MIFCSNIQSSSLSTVVHWVSGIQYGLWLIGIVPDSTLTSCSVMDVCPSTSVKMSANSSRSACTSGSCPSDRLPSISTSCHDSVAAGSGHYGSFSIRPVLVRLIQDGIEGNPCLFLPFSQHVHMELPMTAVMLSSIDYLVH